MKCQREVGRKQQQCIHWNTEKSKPVKEYGYQRRLCPVKDSNLIVIYVSTGDLSSRKWSGTVGLVPSAQWARCLKKAAFNHEFVFMKFLSY